MGAMDGGLFWILVWSASGLLVLAFVGLMLIGVLGALVKTRAAPIGASRASRASRGSRAAPGADPAQAELRRRYAAGEISREEFLQGKVDLE